MGRCNEEFESRALEGWRVEKAGEEDLDGERRRGGGGDREGAGRGVSQQYRPSPEDFRRRDNEQQPKFCGKEILKASASESRFKATVPHFNLTGTVIGKIVPQFIYTRLLTFYSPG
jgi:hypothetical protein